MLKGTQEVGREVGVLLLHLRTLMAENFLLIFGSNKLMDSSYLSVPTVLAFDFVKETAKA